MKALSIINPIAYLVACGVKDVENRSWTTNYRGKLYIHSSGVATNTITGTDLPYGHANVLDLIFNEKRERDAVIRGVEEVLKRVAFKYYGLKTYDEWIEFDEPARDLPFKAGSIIGEVVVQDVKRDAKSPWAAPNCYHWCLTDAKLYDTPIIGIRGRLGLWDYPGRKEDMQWQKAEAERRADAERRRPRRAGSAEPWKPRRVAKGTTG